MKSDTKLWNICLEIYRELFKLATPSFNFDDIIKSKQINKKDWYEDYYLSEARQTLVVEKHITKNKLCKFDARRIRYEVYLGCSPSANKRLTETRRGNK